MKYGRAYHRYFEGYTEIKGKKADGKGTVIRRVYTGKYYQQNLSDREWMKNRVICAGTYSIGVLAMAVASVQKTWSNRQGIMAFFLMLGILSILWLSYGFFPYIASGKKLKQRQYLERMTVISGSVAAGICMGLCGLVACYGIFQACGERTAVISGLFFAVSAAGFLLLFRTEKKIEYIQIENDRVIPDNGFDIDYRE